LSTLGCACVAAGFDDRRGVYGNPLASSEDPKSLILRQNHAISMQILLCKAFSIVSTRFPKIACSRIRTCRFSRYVYHFWSSFKTPTIALHVFLAPSVYCTLVGHESERRIAHDNFINYISSSYLLSCFLGNGRPVYDTSTLKPLASECETLTLLGYHPNMFSCVTLLPNCLTI
jgi:hypothetical protein